MYACAPYCGLPWYIGTMVQTQICSRKNDAIAYLGQSYGMSKKSCSFWCKILTCLLMRIRFKLFLNPNHMGVGEYFAIFNKMHLDITLVYLYVKYLWSIYFVITSGKNTPPPIELDIFYPTAFYYYPGMMIRICKFSGWIQIPWTVDKLGFRFQMA